MQRRERNEVNPLRTDLDDVARMLDSLCVKVERSYR